MKRSRVTEPEPGYLRIEILDFGERKGSFSYLYGNSFTEAELVTFIRGATGTEPTPEQLATIRGALARSK